MTKFFAFMRKPDSYRGQVIEAARVHKHVQYHRRWVDFLDQCSVPFLMAAVAEAMRHTHGRSTGSTNYIVRAYFNGNDLGNPAAIDAPLAGPSRHLSSSRTRATC